MGIRRNVAALGAVGVLLLAGVSFAVWKVSFAPHKNVQVEKPQDEEEDPPSEHLSDNFLNEEKARFKNKSGVEVVLVSFSECEACEAPEFLGIQTEADSQMNSIPSPQEHNFSDSADSRLRSTIVYGRCSDDVTVYQEITLDKDSGAVKNGAPAVSYQKFVAAILPSGQIHIKKEDLKKAVFDKLFDGTAPAGCELLHQDESFAGSP